MPRCFPMCFLAVAAMTVASGCSVTEEYRLERQIAMAEKRERYAFERHACEASLRGAWICTSGSERAREDFPWLHCGCTDNQSALR